MPKLLSNKYKIRKYQTKRYTQNKKLVDFFYFDFKRFVIFVFKLKTKNIWKVGTLNI